MHSLASLSRMPVLGFNTEYRLRAAYVQQPNESASFFDITDALETKTSWNRLTIAGCLPGVSLISGAFRAYAVYHVYYVDMDKVERKERIAQHVILQEEKNWFSENETEAAAAWLQDRKWFAIQEGALAVAEMCQLSIVLAAVHIIKTIFDHAVAAYYQPEVESKEYYEFQRFLPFPGEGLNDVE